MKAYNKYMICAVIIVLSIIIGVNTVIIYGGSYNERKYMVEIERAAKEIEQQKSLDLEKYPLIHTIEKSSNVTDDFLSGSNYDYVIRKIGNTYYRFDYIRENITNKRLIFVINLIMAAAAILIFGTLIFVKLVILKPFNRLNNVPYELAKGNLNVPLKENKSRFFGRFIWGLDLLREKLEKQKKEELDLQKEKKTLILSISHDIKTPLSSIKLYSKALSKNLYRDENKKQEIYEILGKKADEIEAFVSDIILASREDFLRLTVNPGEFYLKDLVKAVESYYSEKLEINRTEFIISDYKDCILKGDFDRSVEIIQNIIENAIKYGDGHFIGIEFNDEEDCRLITVINSGGTLKESELPHIFDSFWRGSNSEGYEGSGLGLYICRQLIMKMDGDIFACIDGAMVKVTVVFRQG